MPLKSSTMLGMADFFKKPKQDPLTAGIPDPVNAAVNPLTMGSVPALTQDYKKPADKLTGNFFKQKGYQV